MSRAGMLTHPAAQAATVHEPVSIDAPAIAEVARFPRAAGGVYRVVRDSLAHQGVGLYRVSADHRYLGSQISRPNTDDCARIEREASERHEPASTKPLIYGYYGKLPDTARSCAISTVSGKKVKRCSGCKVLKPLQDYSLGTGPGGYHRHCRVCVAAHRASRAAS